MIAGSPSEKVFRAMGDKYGYSFPDAIEKNDAKRPFARTSGSYYSEVEQHMAEGQGEPIQHPLATAPQNYHNVSFAWPPASGYDDDFVDVFAAEEAIASEESRLPPAGVSSPPRKFTGGAAVDPPVTGSIEDPERMPPVLRRLRALVNSGDDIRANLDVAFPETRSAFRNGLSRGEVQQGLQVNLCVP
jgi:hypothetical protein